MSYRTGYVSAGATFVFSKEWSPRVRAALPARAGQVTVELLEQALSCPVTYSVCLRGGSGKMCLTVSVAN